MAKKSPALLKLKPSKLTDLVSPHMLVVYAAFLVVIYLLSNSLSATWIATQLLPLSTPQNGSFVLSAQNNSGENGLVTLMAMKNQTKVTISLNGEPSGATQPAHIHAGSCPNPGAIVYPLNSVVNGQSVTTINVKLADLLKMGPSAVNVHKSAWEISSYVSCANLK